MRLLLDTHVWLWKLLDQKRLSRTARDLLDEPSHELFLSPISLWETLMLAERGRLALEPDPVTWVRSAMAVSPTTVAELSPDVTILSTGLTGYPGRDPADRFLVATAMTHDLTIVTADRDMHAYAPLKAVW